MGSSTFQQNLSTMRFAILGAGLTGLATAQFLARRGAEVFVSECGQLSNRVKSHLESLNINFEENGHTERIYDADVIVPSPAIPANSPILQEASLRDIQFIGEIELASQFVDPRRVIAVTGTIGKTTTTHLIAELLIAHGIKAEPVGNIGTPWISRVDEASPDSFFVVEVSSYQLEQIERFSPHIAVLTRFAPHHLERHGSMEAYFQLKSRLFMNQSESDFALILNENPQPALLTSQLLEFSADNAEVARLDMPEHQRENLAAALKAARCVDPAIDLQKIDLEEVTKLPHRIEDCGSIDGIQFYNDSKATTPIATISALKTFSEQNLVHIMGGSDTERDLDQLVTQLASQPVERVLIVGQSSLTLSKALRENGSIEFEVLSSLGEAIELAIQINPEICLFSPAAPSFDQFSSYIERGETFKKVLASYRAKTMITASSDQQLPQF